MPATVLVVEDDPVILDLLEVSFSMEGWTVLKAVDGAAGIEAARTQQPDVIVSDIMMPGVSGLDLVRELKANGDTSAIPILLLSAKAQAADMEAGLAAGADDYVTKPFEPFELLERVGRLLDGQR